MRARGRSDQLCSHRVSSRNGYIRCSASNEAAVASFSLLFNDDEERLCLRYVPRSNPLRRSVQVHGLYCEHRVALRSGGAGRGTGGSTYLLLICDSAAWSCSVLWWGGDVIYELGRVGASVNTVGTRRRRARDTGCCCLS